MAITSRRQKAAKILYCIGIFFVMFCFQCGNYHWQPLPFFIYDKYKYVNMPISFFLSVLLGLMIYKFGKDMFFAARVLHIASAAVVIIYIPYVIFIREWLCAKLYITEDYHFIYCLLCLLGVLFAMTAVKARHMNERIGYSDFYSEFMRAMYWIFSLLFVYIYLYNRSAADNVTVVYAKPNFVPFSGEIGKLVANFSTHSLVHLCGNVAYYVLFAIIVCDIFKKRSELWGMCLPVAVSIAFEAVQYAANIGDTDIDDIIMNTAGAALGVLLHKFIFKKMLRSELCLEL